MRKLLFLLIKFILLVSCISNLDSIEQNNLLNNLTHSELSKDGNLFSYKKHFNNNFEESIQSQPEEDNAVTTKSLIEDENEETIPQVTDETNSQSTNTSKQSAQPEVSEPEQPTSPTPDQTAEISVTETPPKVIYPNAWYDENEPCDWMPDNLRPLDEIGRSVPSFPTSQEAWNWGEAQMYDTASNWYMCGFIRMEGNTNAGTMFYYAYMKSCPNE